MVDLSYSFCDLCALLFEVSHFIVVFLGGWLGYEIAGFVFGSSNSLTNTRCCRYSCLRS